MRKAISILVVLVLAAGLLATSVAAQTSATKTAIGWAGTQAVSAMDDWTTVLAGSVKASTPEDISILFTSESFLATYVYVQTTKNSSGDLVMDSDTSSAAIQIRCMVDGKMADPGIITFDSRLMRLAAFLGQAINTDQYGVLYSAGDQWISIAERTMQAHAFAFVYQNLGSGEHTIQIQAKIALTPSKYATTKDPQPGSTEAYLGTRMLVVDEVNLKQRTFPQ